MASLRESLLSVMDQKHHWGWPLITGAQITKQQLLTHFQQEFEVYVRDFPLLLARVLGRMPAEKAQLVREFAENIYEEQTGGLSKEFSKHKSHPELFLKMMRGLGFAEKDFQKIRLLPTSLAYRSYIDVVTLTQDWRLGAVLLTLFIEGSVEDRARLEKKFANTRSLEEKLKNHSLHKFHNLKITDMDLVRSHHAVEGSHRKSAWETLLAEISSPELERQSIDVMNNALDLWLLFRDGICLEMNLENEEFKRLAGQY